METELFNLSVAVFRQSAAILPRISRRRIPKRRYAGLAPLALGLLTSVFCFQASGQSYSIDWHKIAGGGGTGTNGQYSISGTIGQHDASGLMSGTYSLTGGFWALISVVQTTGAPTLYISHSGNTVTVYWRDVSGWSLVHNGNLAAPISNWSADSSPTLTNGTNYVTLTNAVENLFFRLKQ